MSVSPSAHPRIYRFEARAFSRATEIPERVRMALLALCPEHLRENIVITEELTEGHYRNPIRILTLIAEGEEAGQVARYLLSKLSARDAKHLISTLDRRIDEECTFFVRIDKQAAYLGTIEIAKVPDMISCSISMTKAPRCRLEDAKTLLVRYLTAGGDDLE